MKLYDISMPINESIPVYGNKAGKGPVITTVSDHNTVRMHESVISMNLHTGTHIDAPLHMIKGGSTFESIDISRLITTCRVLDLTGAAYSITADDLRAKDIRPGSFILLKTRNSYFEGFDPGFVYVDISAASYLSEIGISGVGIDSLGIERAQPGHETHKTLLGGGIIILEGLRLADVREGMYKLIALPLRMTGTEASPARAVLIEE
jgi:arylformamidase